MVKSLAWGCRTFLGITLLPTALPMSNPDQLQSNQMPSHPPQQGAPTPEKTNAVNSESSRPQFQMEPRIRHIPYIQRSGV